jgi:hypothetical protein
MAGGKRLLPGYFSSLWADDQTRYLSKLSNIDGTNPYEMLESEWSDDVNLWPAITHIHIGMYLLLNKSPYSSDDLLNYKSMDCYENFVSGFVRKVLVRVFGDKRAVIGKVSSVNFETH